jgi:hypothetical protein
MIKEEVNKLVIFYKEYKEIDSKTRVIKDYDFVYKIDHD